MAVDLIYERLSTTWANDADSSVELFGSRVCEAVENANILSRERSKRCGFCRVFGVGLGRVGGASRLQAG